MRKPAPIIVLPGGSYTMAEACRWLGWSRQRLSKEVHEHGLKVIAGGKAWRFVGSDLLSLSKPVLKRRTA